MKVAVSMVLNLRKKDIFVFIPSRLKALITIFLWLLVLLILLSAGVPYTHSGFFPYLQLIPSFDVLFWVAAVVLLLISVRIHIRPWVPALTLLLATALLVWRNYGSLPDFAGGESHEVKVLCLNVAQFSNATAAVNATVREIKQHDPDIVCLQEFGLYYKWPDVGSVSADFAKRIGMAHYDFSPFPGNIFGTAVFSKYPILSSDTIFSMLSATNEAKSYVFSIGDEELKLTNMHLQSYNFFGKRKEPKSFNDALIETLSRRHSQVRVMMKHQADMLVGDINASVGTVYYEEIAHRFRDVQRAFGKGMLPTHAYLPTRLDYIFTRQRLRPVAFERLTDFPSDHHGLMATIAI